MLPRSGLLRGKLNLFPYRPGEARPRNLVFLDGQRISFGTTGQRNPRASNTRKAADTENLSFGVVRRPPSATPPGMGALTTTKDSAKDFTWSSDRGVVFLTREASREQIPTDLHYELRVRRNNLARRLWGLIAKSQRYDWYIREIPWSRLLSASRVKRLHPLWDARADGSSRSALIRFTASIPAPKHKQVYTHGFHTASAGAEDAHCAKADAVVGDGAETKDLTLEQSRPTLRRSCSEGQLFGCKAIGVRDETGQETTRFLSSDLYHDSNPDSRTAAIDPERTKTNDIDGSTIENVSVQPGDREADHIPLSYQIPADVKRKVLLTSDSSLAAYWHHGLYQGPNGEKVKVHYCKSKETTERVAQFFLNQEVIGFDIEWKPNSRATGGIRDNVSLIQLATEERIALFHLAQYQKHDTLEDLVAPTLKRIMEDPSIAKAGVAVRGDCTRLKKFLGIDSRGLFELSHLYRQVEAASTGVGNVNKRLVSLARQVEEHLQLPLWKGEVRFSDWTKELKLQQIMYAASDSYAGLRLYDILEGKRKSLKPTPPRPSFLELDLPIILPGGSAVRVDEGSVEDECLDEDTDVDEASCENIAKDTNTPPEQNDSSTTFENPTEIKEKRSQVLAAEQWAAEWLDDPSISRAPRATKPYLRAYALWHHSGLSVEDIASVLRDPPLRNSTVTSYILESIRLERLPYDEIRVRDVLRHMPDAIVKTRYRRIRALME